PTARGSTWSTSSRTPTRPSITSRTHRWNKSCPPGEYPWCRPDEGGSTMPKAWSAKRERQYEHIKKSEKEQGRSTDRAKEIAARTVNKQRAESGETKSSKKKS